MVGVRGGGVRDIGGSGVRGRKWLGVGVRELGW